MTVLKIYLPSGKAWAVTKQKALVMRENGRSNIIGKFHISFLSKIDQEGKTAIVKMTYSLQ